MRLFTPSALGEIFSRIRSISFAQYAEDLLLYQVFRPRDRGVYCECGAYHPSHSSNTYKLYLRGWRGITVEPNPDREAAFKRIRPHDRHLVCGIARERGELTYHRFKQDKFNTFELDEYRAALERSGPPITVPCLPLAEVLDKHAPGPVDLLSVDCEGLDLDVLKSNDWSKHRPTAVLIEDIEEYCLRRDGAATQSPTAQYMRDLDYACVTQAMFTFFYFDRRAVDPPGFDIDASQIRG